jgi:diguanylate cyclase (GGDEF)-like protein
LSIHDPLTDLYNRAYFEQILRDGLKAVDQPVSMLMLDVNGLKMVNDTWGHSAGDVLLRDTATILTRAMRGEDIIARIGGDEFVVIMPGTDRAASDKVIERIRHAIQQFNGTHPDHQPISLAVGSATVDLNEALMEVLKRADQAMYDNKREQR